MSVVIGTCERCHGTMKVPNPGYPGSYGCTYCDGSGVRKKRGYGGYKNVSTAARALANGTGMRCTSCEGTGRCPYPEYNPCSCRTGSVLLEAHAGDVLPEEVDLYGYIPNAVAATLAEEITWTVMPEDRPGSWMEMHLGIGTVTSVTDYGTAWRNLMLAVQTDQEAGITEFTTAGGATTAYLAELVAEARKSLAGATQWIKVARKDTRQIAERAVIQLHHNGWNVLTQATLATSVGQVASLPPTYTPDVLNRPVSS